MCVLSYLFFIPTYSGNDAYVESFQNNKPNSIQAF